MSGPVFADYEPEDAWDATDPPDVQLGNLRARVLLLYLTRRKPPVETLADIALAVIVARARRDQSTRDALRVEQLTDDIATVAARLGGVFDG